MSILENLPTLNACLNFTSAVLLVMGRQYIIRGERAKHKRMMISAFSVSIVFLISYLVYHYVHGTTRFTGPEPAKTVYFIILGTHTLLAVLVPVLATLSISRGLMNQIPLHKKISRWTYPIWLYVSVTGVLVYLMLYQFFPAH